MPSPAFSRSTPHLVLGVLVILVGLIFLMDNLEMVDAREYLRYWPVLLIVFGLVKLFQPAGSHGRGWGLVLTLVGLFLLLRKLDLIWLTFGDLWPLILVFVGGSIIWGSIMRTRHVRAVEAGGVATDESTINGTAILGGFTRSNTSQDFRGGDLTAIMGGCEIDLRQASIKGEEAVLNIFAFWGGVEVKVPEDWKVVLKGTPILGGFADNTRPRKEPSAKRLVVTGTAIMGGAEIRN